MSHSVLLKIEDFFFSYLDQHCFKATWECNKVKQDAACVDDAS